LDAQRYAVSSVTEDTAEVVEDTASAAKIFRPPTGRARATGRVRLGSARLRTSYATSVALIPSRGRLALLVAAVAAVASIPWALTSTWTTVATAIALAVPGAIALNILIGIAGQVSIGNAALLSVGSVVTATIVRSYSAAPFPLLMLASGTAAALVGAIVAIPALRVRGLYLIIGTLALQFIINYLVEVYQSHSVGDSGWNVPAPRLGALQITSRVEWYFFVVAVAAAAMLVMANIKRSRMGRAWVAVRDGDAAAAIIGVNVVRAKVQAFVFTSFIIGVQGSVVAQYSRNVQYSNYNLELAVSYIAIVFIGGTGSVGGTVLGATVVIGLPFLLQQIVSTLPAHGSAVNFVNAHQFDIEYIVYGVLIVVFMIYAPRGLAQLIGRWSDLLRQWPFSRRRVLR
jgi:branched-chain amino acid transport system permease protein